MTDSFVPQPSTVTDDYLRSDAFKKVLQTQTMTGLIMMHMTFEEKSPSDAEKEAMAYIQSLITEMVNDKNTPPF